MNDTTREDSDEAAPAASVVAQVFVGSATLAQEPPAWQHQPPTCGRCGARMRLPRHPAGDGWTWGAFGWQHACGWHR